MYLSIFYKGQNIFLAFCQVINLFVNGDKKFSKSILDTSQKQKVISLINKKRDIFKFWNTHFISQFLYYEGWSMSFWPHTSTHLQNMVFDHSDSIFWRRKSLSTRFFLMCGKKKKSLGAVELKMHNFLSSKWNQSGNPKLEKQFHVWNNRNNSLYF